LHNADVDFCIVVPEAKHEEDLRHYRNRLSKQPRSIYNMFFLAARLREMGMRNVEAIGHASVPICKFIDSHTGLECDINTHNILGIENTKMIQTYCEMDARIRPLVFAVKQFVKQKKINNRM
jgi:DNA polymerase sigma